ncbi:uncharacterized protein LOC132200132 [Neocloeon triangulifer]|uniref:uncharacterized protein LOC132200132 n=1 Tax=Neocloeon triangulifer TaxID=2078957 RepID=UPI00286EE6EF|nr:uncharacterized protein LOC132200132 [Neocloeon triangulifer]
MKLKLGFVIYFFLFITTGSFIKAENVTESTESTTTEAIPPPPPEEAADEERLLADKKAGLTFLDQVLSLTTNNTSASVQNRFGGDASTSGRANGSGTTLSLDLTDPAQRSQFLEELMAPGTSGSYATSNSYQQFGKTVNYAISLSYAPLQPNVAANIRQGGEITTTTESTPVATPKTAGEGLEGRWGFGKEPWPAWRGHSYYYPYYYIRNRPSFYYPALDH